MSDAHKIIRGVIFFIIIAFISVSMSDAINAAETEESTPVIKSLEIKGNKKIEEETIQAKIKSRVGNSFSQQTVQNDIKTLYGLGYFDDIKVEVESFEDGIKLIFAIKEKPTIVSIDFQGNKNIKTDDLKEKITITPGAFANQSLIQDNIEKIIMHYQSEGFWQAKVLPVVRNISEDSVALTFQVNEGTEVTIDKIIIEGNKNISSKDILKAMETKERWFFSFITGSGIYKKDELKTDVERIRQLYHSKGYIYVVISEPEVTLNSKKDKLDIKISVSEGEQFKVGEVSINGNTIFSSTELYQHIKTSTGKIFNRTALRDDIDSILDLYLEKGYAMADINPLVDVDAKERLVKVLFSITEGDIYKVGQIEISGNEKTRDKVIRREIRLDEGDTFNNKLLKRSYQRLTNLNYFETVELVPQPHPEKKLVDIDVKVKEKLTGMLTIGGGYSSVDKFMVMGEITQSNLFGKGLSLKVKAELSSIRTNYNISIRDPWFMDKPVSALFSIYNESFQYPDYYKKSTGGSVGFGKELSEYVAGNITYNFEDVEISGIKGNAATIIKEQEGKKITSSISPSIWRDTRDNYLDPTSGTRHALYTTYAGIGGDNYFGKLLADSVWYFPAMWGTTFSLRGRAGYASGLPGETLPLYERFYVGGINTVRGLGFGEAGPRDEQGEKIGGKTELIFNAEYIFPIEKNIKLKGVVFFDAGRSFDKTENVSISALRPTTGFGFRWLSPFGPIRLEWGYNLSRKSDEGSNKIEFTMGGVF